MKSINGIQLKYDLLLLLTRIISQKLCLCVEFCIEYSNILTIMLIMLI